MKNILTTIPKGKFKDWATAEKVCSMCDGTTNRKHTGWPETEEHEEGEGTPWYWLVNCLRLPKQSGIGAVCFMIFDGMIRGYFDIVDTDLTENWRERHGIGKERTTQSLILANWHPLVVPIPHTGFQGYRYTELRP